MLNPFEVKALRVRAFIKAFMQQAPNELYLYTIEQMGEDIGAKAFREGKSGPLSLRGVPRNTTKQLRFQTNRLGRALSPGEAGNVTKVVTEKGEIFVEYGIDLKVVPYARIHEFGGTVKHPGGTPYKMIEGRAVFVSKENGKDLDTTRPHNIGIPARPYLRPGFTAYLQKQIPRLFARLTKAIESD
jgi:phage gpG-like protein